MNSYSKPSRSERMENPEEYRRTLRGPVLVPEAFSNWTDADPFDPSYVTNLGSPDEVLRLASISAHNPEISPEEADRVMANLVAAGKVVMASEMSKHPLLHK